MSIHRERRIAIMSVFLAALAGCVSLGNAMASLSREQVATVREECGLMPAKSRMKKSADLRRRTYLACKRNVLEKETDRGALT
ncbi:hypothetical protein [Henriciella aquimarina]|uniref:hypothetical protein n=1 Tax=Henriciella aquimarina TaxID=545261 RepID=UPI0009FECA3B|nr:hypothetical protein [Henriciella aquimarina]